MKRCLIPAIALAVLPNVAYPQGGTTAPVTVTVQADVTLAREGTTSFGTIGTSARTVTIGPTTPAPDQSVALFTASGAPNANVVVTFDATTDLCHATSGCSVRIVFTPNVAESQELFCCSSLLTNGGIVRLNGAGVHYFWLGGSITTVDQQPSGVYSGLFSMLVEYQ